MIATRCSHRLSVAVPVSAGLVMLILLAGVNIGPGAASAGHSLTPSWNVRTIPRPVPPGGDSAFQKLAPIVALYGKGVPFKRDTTVQGVVDSTSQNIIRFRLPSGEAFAIEFALPGDLALRKVSSAAGKFSYHDTRSPGSADQVFTVTVGSSVLGAFVWKVSDHPVSVDLAPGLKIMQDGSVIPGVAIVGGVDTVRLPPGRPYPFSVGGQRYTAYLQTSVHRTVPGKYQGGDAGTGFILRAVLISRDTN